MARFVKILLGLVGIAVATVLALAVFVLVFVDPNEYRATLSEAVVRETGRTLGIGGDLGLELLPCCSVTAADVTLGNPPGRNDGQLLSAQSLAMSLNLVPLITERRVEVGRIVLEGVDVDLVAYADGENNWTFDGASQAGPGDDAGESRVESIRLEGIEIIESSVRYRDLGAGTDLSVDDISLTTGPVVSDQPVTVAGSLGYSDEESGTTAAIEFSATVAIDPADTSVEMTALVADARLGSDPLSAAMKLTTDRIDVSPAGIESAAIALSGDIEYEATTISAEADTGVVRIDADGQTIDVAALDARADIADSRLIGGEGTAHVTAARLTSPDGGARFVLEGLGLDATTGGVQLLFDGEGSVSESLDISGRLNVPAFSPKDLIRATGEPVPVTTDATALTAASADGTLTVDSDSISLADLTVTLDQTTARGFFRIASIERTSIRFDLVGDAMDIDRYLAPAEESDATVDSTPVDNIELPVETLRGLRMGGRVKLRQARIDGMDMSDLVVNVVARNGNVSISPLKASLYSGGFDGGIIIDVTGNEPSVTVTQELGGVAIGDLLAARGTLDNLTGTLGLSIDATANGLTVGDLKRKLSGQVAFRLDDAVYDGVDVWHVLRTQYARLRSRPPPEGPGEGRTTIDELRGTGMFRDGALVSDDFTARIPFILATGQGRVDLLNDTIDYRLSALVEETPEFEDGERLEDLTGLRLPLRVSGPMSDPGVRVDLAEVLKDVAVRELTDKVTDRLFDRLRKRLGVDEEPDSDGDEESL